MPPRRAVNGRRDSVVSAEGPIRAAGAAGLAAQDWWRTSGARHPFQGEASLPGRGPLPGREALPLGSPSRARGGATAALVLARDCGRSRSDGALPLASQACGGSASTTGSARGRPVLPVGDSAWNGAASMPALLRKGQLHLPGTAAPSPRAFTFLRVHLPMASLLERRVPDGGVAAVTRGWGQPLSWDSRGRYDSDHFDVRRLIY